MKKVFIGSIAASALALGSFAMSVASANAAFSTYLHVGSTGSDVSALQTWLVSKSFLTMPAGVSMGYFGNLTKAAVIKYQVSASIPGTGYVGPLTVAALNNAGTASGSTVSTGTGSTVSSAPVAMDGTDGSITATYSAYVSSGQTLKKGDTKDVFSVRLKATSGNVTVNRFDVHFSERPWLDFSSLTLHDSAGKVIATKTLSSAADVTEVTVGTDYLVRFDGVNYTVNPSSDAILVVGVNVLSASDKIVGQTVTVSVPTGAIRTVNGKGYTDSSIGTGTTNTVTLSSTGSTGALYTRISPNTPAQRIVTVSSSQVTPNVVLGVFSVKSQNQSSVLSQFNVNINNSAGYGTSTIFQNVRLVDGSNTYGANSLSAGGTTFSNLNIMLTQDQWKDLSVIADVNSSSTINVNASTTLVAASMIGVDANYNTVSLTNASNATSNDTNLLLNGIAITNVSVTPGSAVNQGNSTVGQGVTFNFTVTNNGNNDVFISKTPSTALATSTTGSVGSPAAASSTITSVTVTPGTYAGDTSVAYDVPAGVSRVFAYSGSVDNTSGTNGLRVFSISTIYFGTTSGNTTSSNVAFGLEGLVFKTTLAH